MYLTDRELFDYPNVLRLYEIVLLTKTRLIDNAIVDGLILLQC